MQAAAAARLAPKDAAFFLHTKDNPMSSNPTTVTPTPPTNSGSLISSERVTGTNVYNRDREKLGSVEALMIDKMSGQVRFAVMSFGGFLGMGEKYHQLPWNGLSYDLDNKGYVVNLTRDALNAAPMFTRDEIDSFDYGSNSDEIDSYYGKIDGFRNRAN